MNSIKKPMISFSQKNITKINWDLDASKVLAHIHGLSPSPGAWFEYENERFKVLRAKKFSANGNPGIHLDENLTIACKIDSIRICLYSSGVIQENNVNFDCPFRRSVNMIGTSFIVNPFLHAKKCVSIWNA